MKLYVLVLIGVLVAPACAIPRARPSYDYGPKPANAGDIVATVGDTISGIAGLFGNRPRDRILGHSDLFGSNSGAIPGSNPNPFPNSNNGAFPGFNPSAFPGSNPGPFPGSNLGAFPNFNPGAYLYPNPYTAYPATPYPSYNYYPVYGNVYTPGNNFIPGYQG